MKPIHLFSILLLYSLSCSKNDVKMRPTTPKKLSKCLPEIFQKNVRAKTRKSIKNVPKRDQNPDQIQTIFPTFSPLGIQIGQSLKKVSKMSQKSHQIQTFSLIFSPARTRIICFLACLSVSLSVFV